MSRNRRHDHNRFERSQILTQTESRTGVEVIRLELRFVLELCSTSSAVVEGEWRED